MGETRYSKSLKAKGMSAKFSKKEAVRPFVQRGIRAILPSHSRRLPPHEAVTARVWIERNSKRSGVQYVSVYPPRTVHERPPITTDAELPWIFREHLVWRQPEAYVCTIPNGRVWGRRGTVITDDNVLLGDVSREFGAYKGVYNENHSVFKQLLLPSVKSFRSRTAVVACPGSETYFHWLFDTLPRLHLLRASGLFESVEQIVIDYQALPFQVESLQALEIPDSKLLVPIDQWNFHISSDSLVVPSLPAEMGTIADWVGDFLRRTFRPVITNPKKSRRLFVSRRKAPSRRETNYEEILRLLSSRGFEEYFAEERPIAQVAQDFANADWVVGVHGGGLANLVFATPGTKVIELFPPRHMDSLFWIMSNQTGCHHAYVFGEGEPPAHPVDLVAAKVDSDITIPISKLASLMDQMEQLR
jgi:capsular polysaccharide biosynthesis protein